MTALPPWMRPCTTADDWQRLPLAPEISARPRRNLVRRGLQALESLFVELLADEAIAARPGLLQSLDARAKVVGLVGLLVAVTLVHRLPALAAAHGLCLLLAAASRVPVRRVARVWLVVPLFSAAIMLPAMLSVVTPGMPVLTLWHFPGGHLGPWQMPPTLAITDAGLLVAGRFVLRVAACVSLALLLTATTRTARLFHGLRGLGVPRLFVMLLAMMARYLSVLLRAAGEIHLAKLSRSIATGTVRQEQAWAAAGIGSLFRRTHALGHAVYLAMLSRGYTGEPHLLDNPRWTAREWAFLTGMALVAAGLVLWGS